MFCYASKGKPNIKQKQLTLTTAFKNNRWGILETTFEISNLIYVSIFIRTVIQDNCIVRKASFLGFISIGQVVHLSQTW